MAASRKKAKAQRDRVVELVRVRADEIVENDRNYRSHPAEQREALAELIGRLGVASALLAYKSERNNGKLTLIDGHLRRADRGTQVWPVLVLDLDDEEADLLLATHDPLTMMARTNGDALEALLERCQLEQGSATARMLDAAIMGAAPGTISNPISGENENNATDDPPTGIHTRVLWVTLHEAEANEFEQLLVDKAEPGETRSDTVRRRLQEHAA